MKKITQTQIRKNKKDKIFNMKKKDEQKIPLPRYDNGGMSKPHCNKELESCIFFCNACTCNNENKIYPEN
jgi:hypothetical protein